MTDFRKRLVWIALVLTAATSPSFGQIPEKSERVSLIQLLAQPEKYEGKLVEVAGFVNLEPEGTAIWLHREDFSNGILPNSIWVNVNKCIDFAGNPMSGYASLMGKFTTKHHGHMGLWPGEINQVGECFPLPTVGSGS